MNLARNLCSLGGAVPAELEDGAPVACLLPVSNPERRLDIIRLSIDGIEPSLIQCLTRPGPSRKGDEDERRGWWHVDFLAHRSAGVSHAARDTKLKIFAALVLQQAPAAASPV
jgi:hypothetical protein